MFYTYAHYTPEGRLFYIGKGRSERRAYNFHNRNRYWKTVVAKHGKPNVAVLAHWDTEEEAFSHEVLLISCFKDMGYKLCNLTDGGEGASGRVLSEEHKQKIGAAQKGKPGKKPTPETLVKLRISHLGQKAWNKGLKGVYTQTKETVEKRAAKLIGNTFKGFYKYIGTNLVTGEVISFVGDKQIKDAGFQITCVRKCADGKLYRKSHKGFAWTKELLKETS